MATLTAMTYNTHLFGTWTGIPGTHWQDDLRFQTLVPMLTSSGADVIAIQEMWSSDFVSSLVGAVAATYPNNYYDLHTDGVGHPSNPSGLVLLMNSRVTLDPDKKPLYYDYIHELRDDLTLPSKPKSVGDALKHWKDELKHLTAFDTIQDMPTGKGFLMVPAIVDGAEHITLFVTHMPTSSGNFPQAINDCFKKLTDHVPEDTSPVLVLADFNVSETDPPLDNSDEQFHGHDRYNLWIGPNGDTTLAADYVPTLLRKQLKDAYRTIYPDKTANPGFSVVGATNTCWRHFNNDKVKQNEYDHERIDHMMYRGLTPQSMTVVGTAPPSSGTVCYPDTVPACANTNSWIWMDHGTEKRDLSDHYPVMGTFSL